MSAKEDQAIVRAMRSPGKPSRSVRQYEKTVRKYDKKYDGRSRPGKVVQPGAVSSVEKQARGATFQTQNGAIRLAFLMPDVLQVRVRRDADFGDLMPFSYATLSDVDWPNVDVALHEEQDTITVMTSGMKCVIERANGHLSIIGEDNHYLIHTHGYMWQNDAIAWVRELPASEAGYGLGQRARRLGLRGEAYSLQNYDPALYLADEDPCYYSIPFYLGMQEHNAIGILWDNPAVGNVDIGKTKADEMRFSAEGGELCFYVMVSPGPREIYDRYTILTGRPYMPPLWALGYHQSRYGYKDEKEFRQLAQQFRTRRIPCDVLHFDIDYMDEYRCFTWNRQSFKDLAGLVQELSAQGFKSVSILDPALKADKKWDVFQEGTAQDLFLKYPNGDLYTGVVWPGEAAFPDFTNPATREWWAGRVAEFIRQTGMAGVWNDMNEPTIFRAKSPDTLPHYIPYHWDGHGKTHQDGGNNTYGHQMACATQMGLDQVRPEKRSFTFTRTGYAGVQRYASSWTGDNLSTWEHLRLSIAMVVNLGLSGVPFTGPDVGGFAGAPSPELFTRWIQVGCLMPFFRVHTSVGTPPQEPWSFGSEYEPIIRRYIELRYQLLPYFYSVMAEATQYGLPFLRPGFFAAPNDKALREQSDAFLIGDALFAAPIVEPGATKRKVYLPPGAWYDFWSDRLVDGSREIEVEAPLDKLPLFARFGRVIPMWPVQQYVGESKVEELTLRVYSGIGETTLYEDEGEGKSYLDGNYRYSYLTCKLMPGAQFGIDWRTAGSYQPPYERVRVEIVGVPAEPNEITIDSRPAPLAFFEHGVLEIVTKPFQELRLIGRRKHDDSLADKTLMRRPPGLG